MDQPLRILHLEDDPRDAAIVRDTLEAGGIVCDIALARSREEFVAALDRGGVDLILGDYSLPSFDGMSALRIVRERVPDIPFIFVSGKLGEEVAIEALKLGAMDYVLKERMSTVVGAVRNALREAQHRVERKRAENQLRASEERFRALVQFSFDVYWETDAAHRFTRQEFSDRLADAPARDAQIGKTPWEIPYVEPDAEGWRKYRATVEAHLPYRDFELARPTASGGVRYISASGLPVFDEHGRFVGYRGVGRNITERRLPEAEHREHVWFLESMDRIHRALQGTLDVEEMMSDVLEAVLDIYACDRAWLVYPCDPGSASWRAVMEHTHPQFPGAFALGSEFPIDEGVAAVFATALAAPGAVVFGAGHPLALPPNVADRFQIQSQIAIAIDAKTDKPYLFGLHQCSRPRDWTAPERRLLQEIGRRLGDGLSTLSMLRNLRDSEERFRALVQFSFDVWYWETDAEHRFTRQEVSAWPSDAPPFPRAQIGKTRWDHPSVDLDEQGWRDHRATVDAHLPFRDFERAIPAPDGSKRYHSVSGLPVFDEAGRFVGYRGVGRDITARKRAEAERREHVWFLESMDRINRAIQGTDDLERMMSDVLLATLEIFACDRAWLVYPCDPAAPSWHAVMEHTRAEYPGAFAARTQFPIDTDVAAVFSAALAAPGSVLLGPARSPVIPPQVGEQFAIRSQIAMAIDAKSAKAYLLGLHQCSRPREWTIPEQRLFQEIGRRFGDALASLSTLRSLRDSEARFRTFVDHARDAFFLMDEKLTIVDVNVQACESLGYGREELIGTRPRDFDASLDELSIARLAERARAGETITFETLHRRKDGTRFPVEIRSHAFRQQGEEFYLALVRDITERKRVEEDLRASEDRYRTLVDFAADAFMTHAEDGRVIDVNPQACENLGYTRDELIGMKPADFDANFDREELRRVGERVGAGETVTIETRHRRKDGSVFPVELRLRQVAQGDRWIAISLARDITARKRGEEERDTLRRLEADLMRMSRVITMGELTASIAHEVNQPLGAMVANAAACERWLASQPPQTAEARKALKTISADGQRASAVIGRIRALMKRQSPRKEPLDMNEAIREVLALVRQQLRHSDVVLRLADELPRIDGDKVQLQQVLLNLIANAIDAMSGIDGRSRELTIVSRQDGANVVIEVRDSGIGLNAERAERLFEAFYTTKEEGMGIGLAISRSIVEAHEGQMRAVPNVPYGAVFLVSLPVTVQ